MSWWAPQGPGGRGGGPEEDEGRGIEGTAPCRPRAKARPGSTGELGGQAICPGLPFVYPRPPFLPGLCNRLC